MVLKLGRLKIGERAASPWESIDPKESVGLTTHAADTDADGQWFTSAPPGEWEMEPLASAVEDEEGEAAESGEIATPFDGLNDGEEEQASEEEEAYPSRGAVDKGAWTISVLCMGLGIIAACLIIPQTDANRRLVYQREQLRLDLGQVQKQIAVNKEFLAKMESDPQLTERLAQREMRAVEKGEAVVNTNTPPISAKLAASAERMSPFGIVNVPPPPALVPYKPVGGAFASLCRNPQSHMYMLGAGMIMVAGGLVLGGSERRIGDVAVPAD